MSKEPTPTEWKPPKPENHEALFKESIRLRAESKAIARRLRDVQADASADRAAQRAALNLLEETVVARETAERESAERQRAERELAAELAATSLLQRLSGELIRDERGNTFYELIVETAVALMRSQCGSLQRLDPRSKILRLLAWKGFDPDSAKFWGAIAVDTGTAYGASLTAGRRLIVPDVRQCAWLAGIPLEHYERCGIRAIQSTPLFSRGGELLGMISTHWRHAYQPTERDLRFLDLLARQAADLLERRRNVEALRESQERLRLVVENAREYAIFSMDLERRITSWNTGALAILGYTQEEAIGQSGDIVFTPEDRAAGVPAQEAGKALNEGRADDERWHQRKDGSRFWGSGMMMPMDDARGEAVGLVKIFRDHTERRRAKEALEQSHAELWEALQTKDHFLAVLSHELRTPLTPVLMAVDYLARLPDVPAAVREELEMIRRNVEVEADLIKDLLDVTRIGRGKFAIKRAPLDFHEVIRRSVDVSQPDIDGKQQRLVIALEAAGHRVNGDSARLQQVVWNLLKNASKFTPNGGEIRVRTFNGEDTRVVLEVTDTGIGIEPAALSRIFDPFIQGADEIARRYGGLGLGLAIARAAVDAHGGEIHAQSAGRGEGATFTVALPLCGES